MTFSSLCEYIKESPNKYGKRTHSIDTIAIHCFVGQFNVVNGVNTFSKKGYKWSCNYVVDKEGKVGGVLREEFASICTSSSKVDNRAITIETSCNVFYPYKITDKCYQGLVNLVADICKRNNIKSVKWSFNKDDRKSHRGGCNMEVHRDYANKSCPGDDIYNKMPTICNAVNNILNSNGQIVSGLGLGIQTHPKVGTINFNQLDYSLVYDYNFYKNKYHDLAKNGLKTKEQYYFHFVTMGIKEFRQGNADFSPSLYMKYNRDLEELFVNDYKWYYAHYILSGKKEGRKTLNGNQVL